MNVEIGASYSGPRGTILTVEAVSADWITCRCGPGRVTFAARDAAKWLSETAAHAVKRVPPPRGLGP